MDEKALCDGLNSGRGHSAALDVFEAEPLRQESRLKEHVRCILRSHNASNTEEAVARTKALAIRKLMEFLRRVEN